VYVFKTPHHPNCSFHADLPAVDVAVATSAAPTYFPAHEVPGLGTFIDGGLWANCPAMVGLVEALDFLGQTPEQVRMLSLSTTSYPFRLEEPGQLRGVLGWAPKVCDTLMFGQAQSAVAMATCLLRRGLFHRIDYKVPPGTFRLDKAACTGELIKMGRMIAELNENMSVVKRSFLDAAGRAVPAVVRSARARDGTRTGRGLAGGAEFYPRSSRSGSGVSPGRIPALQAGPSTSGTRNASPSHASTQARHGITTAVKSTEPGDIFASPARPGSAHDG